MRIGDWSSDVCSSDLDQFSRACTICVLVIAATGLINSQMIVGAENLGRSLSSPYGQLLLAKLALFALMLALAAANRWRLTPALAAAADDDAESVDSDPDAALAAMRRRSEEHTSALQSLMRISYAV